MAADDLILDTGLPEAEAQEIDQPSVGNSVSLTDLLGEADGKPAAETKETGAAGQTGKPGDAAPPSGKEAETVYRTQADFDRAFGQRADGLRRQWEREHADDLAIAKAIKGRYTGKSAAEIQEAIFQDEAKQLALDTGYSEEEAASKLRARRDFERRQSLPEGVDPEIMDRMSSQMADFQNKHGIDLVPVMEADESLLELVEPNGDLRNVMIEVLARQAAQGAKAPTAMKQAVAAVAKQAVPKVERAGAAPSSMMEHKFTDAEIDRIDAELQKGHYVRLK